MSTPSFDIIVCGSLHLDVMVRAPALPQPDETVVGRSWGFACGGKGGNQAVHAAAAGARTAMISRVGDDLFGQRLLDNLDRRQVDRSEVPVDGTSGSGMSVAIVDQAGDYGAVIVSGANLAIGASGIRESWERLGGSRILILQNEVPEPVNLAAAHAAREAGATVILNAAPFRTFTTELLDLVDILVVNRIEASQLSGQQVADSASAVAALASLGASARSVVVTLGADGLVVSNLHRSPEVIKAEPVEAVSTHGAGDCFVGSLAAAMSAGRDLVQACRMASHAAARHVSQSPVTS